MASWYQRDCRGSSRKHKCNTYSRAFRSVSNLFAVKLTGMIGLEAQNMAEVASVDLEKVIWLPARLSPRPSGLHDRRRCYYYRYYRYRHRKILRQRQYRVETRWQWTRLRRHQDQQSLQLFSSSPDFWRSFRAVYRKRRRSILPYPSTGLSGDGGSCIVPHRTFLGNKNEILCADFAVDEAGLMKLLWRLKLTT